MCFNTRKFISVFLSAAMLLTASSLSALAEETEDITEVMEAVERTETEIEETVVSDNNVGRETQQDVSETEEEQTNNNINEVCEMTSDDIILAATATGVSSGTCGDALIWSLDEDGTLTIRGTGDMYDYSGSSYTPWDEYSENITKVIINEGVTHIGEFAFWGNHNLRQSRILCKVFTKPPK